MNRSGRAAWPVVLALLAFALEPWQFPHGLRSARAAEVLTNQNVIAMVRAGLPESLILSKIQSTDARFDLSSSGLISLKQGGVSDTVLLAMMNRLNAGSTTASAAPPPAPAYQPPPAPGQPAPPPAYQPPAYTPPAPQGAPGCPQLSQPDPYQDMRGALAQLRAQAGQPGAPNQAQVQPLVAQVQSAIDARDAALRQGACDTSQYDQQIGTMVASLQSALSAGSAPPPGYSPPPGSQPPPAQGYQAGAPPGYPQQGGQPQPGYQYPPQTAGAPPGTPGAQPSPMPSAGEIFSKLFDMAVEKFAGKSKKSSSDGGSGFSSGNQPPPPAYTDPSAGQPGYASPQPGYAPPPPGYSAPPPGYAPPPPSYGQPQPGAAPPPGYAPPPPSYTPPPTGYTPPPPSYTPPPTGYSPPPPSYTPPPAGYVPPPSAPPTGYVPPPPAYTPPPPGYTPPPTTGSVAPPPTYTPPPGLTQSTSPSGLFPVPIPQRSTAASPQSAAVTPVLPPKPFPVPADVQGLGKVAGIVRGDSGAVIPGAIVSVIEWNKMMSTGSDGSFSLQGPAAQRVTIQVQAYGYNTQTIVVSAGPGAVTTQNFALVWARRPVGTSGR